MQETALVCVSMDAHLLAGCHAMSVGKELVAVQKGLLTLRMSTSVTRVSSRSINATKFSSNGLLSTRVMGPSQQQGAASGPVLLYRQKNFVGLALHTYTEEGEMCLWVLWC